MKQVSVYQVETVTICPYCGDEQSDSEWGGCCGESSAHFETAYLYQDEIYRSDEIELITPLFETIEYKFRLITSRRFHRLKLRQFRDRVSKLYDGQNSWILRLRQVTGFQWTKLDCLILKQLHDFPLYYTSPAERLRMRKDGILYCVSQWEKTGSQCVNLVPRITDSERDWALSQLEAASPVSK